MANLNEIIIFKEESQADTYFTEKTYTGTDSKGVVHTVTYDDNNLVLVADDKNFATEKYVDDKIKDVELFKFPNVTIIGQPTINNGQISNFSRTNYCKFPFIVNFQNQPFTINFDITTGENVVTQENILDSDFGLAFAVRNRKFVIAISTNGTNWNLGEGVGSLTVEAMRSYRIRINWNGTRYLVSYSTDGGQSYIDDITINSNVAPYPKQMFIGVGENWEQVVNFFSGIINLNYADLTIANKLVWQGMDDVGLATRADVSLSNIDEAGEQKIKDVANPHLKGIINLNEHSTPATRLLLDSDITEDGEYILEGEGYIGIPSYNNEKKMLYVVGYGVTRIILNSEADLATIIGDHNYVIEYRNVSSDYDWRNSKLQGKAEVQAIVDTTLGNIETTLGGI